MEEKKYNYVFRALHGGNYMYLTKEKCNMWKWQYAVKFYMTPEEAKEKAAKMRKNGKYDWQPHRV